MPRSSHVRSLTARSAIAAIAASGALLAAASTATAAPVFATNDGDAPICSNELLPGISSDGQKYTDAGVAVLVGGSYIAHAGAAESEGRLVVSGTTTIDAGQFNVGRAGGGSQITPAGGSDVVISGTSVSVKKGSTLDVNHGIDGGGNVVAAGAISGTVAYNGGSARNNDSGAKATVAGAVSTLNDVSGQLAGLTTTGFLSNREGHPALVGDGSDDTQIFSLTAAEADSLDAVTFVGIDPSAAIVVNVSGESARLDTIHTAVDTISNRADSWERIGTLAPRLLWNFPDATDLTLDGGSQLVGSILAPKADVTDTTNTNGRLWIGGDLAFGASGNGLEHHNYPWTGIEELGCEPVVPEIPEQPKTSKPVIPPSVVTPAPTTVPEEPEEPETTAPVTEVPDETEPDDSEPSETPSEAPVATETTSPSTEVLGTSVPSPASTEASEESDGLAVTGATIGWAASVAGLLLAAGITLLVLRRRTA